MSTKGTSSEQLPCDRIATTTAAGIGYALARDLWVQGFMTEAASAVVDPAFQRLPIERLDSFALAANVASTRVMEKLGMQRERLLRQRHMQCG